MPRAGARAQRCLCGCPVGAKKRRYAPPAVWGRGPGRAPERAAVADAFCAGGSARTGLLQGVPLRASLTGFSPRRIVLRLRDEKPPVTVSCCPQKSNQGRAGACGAAKTPVAACLCAVFAALCLRHRVAWGGEDFARRVRGAARVWRQCAAVSVRGQGAEGGCRVAARAGGDEAAGSGGRCAYGPGVADSTPGGKGLGGRPAAFPVVLAGGRTLDCRAGVA